MTPPPTVFIEKGRMFAGTMDTQNNKLPQRKHPRLKNYNYAQNNSYFVTICAHEKKYIFGKPQELSIFGKIAADTLTEIPRHFPDIAIDHFVVMPNHVHAILSVTCAGTDLSVVIGQYKAHVTKQIHQAAPGIQVWQTSFHDHIIRNDVDYTRIWNYIDGNPLKWEDDCFYCG